MRNFLVLALAGCASSGTSLESAKIETLDYSVPSGWTSRNLSVFQRPTFEWKPEGDNERKESLVVSRVSLPALTVEKNRGYLRRNLVEASNQLPEARFSSPTSFVTRGGLRGMRVEGSFKPPSQAGSYHRTHAVLVDGTSIVHVLYTARDPDREHIEAVLDGFRPGA